MDDFAELYINKGILFGIAVVEDDGDIVLAITPRHTFAVNALDEHALRLTLHYLEILDFVLQRNLSHDITALGFHFFWHLVKHCCSLRAGAY